MEQVEYADGYDWFWIDTGNMMMTSVTPIMQQEVDEYCQKELGFDPGTIQAYVNTFGNYEFKCYSEDDELDQFWDHLMDKYGGFTMDVAPNTCWLECTKHNAFNEGFRDDEENRNAILNYVDALKKNDLLTHEDYEWVNEDTGGLSDEEVIQYFGDELLADKLRT